MIGLLLLPFTNFFLLLPTLLVVFVFWLHHRLTFWKRHGVPQSILHVKNLVATPMNLADQKLMQKMGKIVGTYEMIFPTIVITEPEFVNDVLVKNFQKFADHRMWMPKGAPFNRGLSSLPYHEWKPSRAVLTPLFTSNNLKKMQHLLEDATTTLFKHLDNQMSKNNEFDIRHFIEGNMMDVITRCIFGTVIDSVNDPNNPIVTHARLIFGTDPTIPQMLAFSIPNLMWKFGVTAFDIRALNFLTAISHQIIKERAAQKSNNHRDLLQLMIDAEREVQKESGNDKKKFDMTEIIDNCILFFIAGYDTTATTIVTAIYHLAKNPDVQKLVVDEIDKQLDQDLDYEKMKQMKYLDAFLNESMRLYPSVNRIDRKALEDCYLGDVFIPKDTYIAIPIYAVHRDGDSWEQPDVFKVERFLPENRKNIRPGTFVPFADGPRNCVGYRFALVMVKMCLIKLLQKYKFAATDKTRFEEHNGRVVNMPKAVVVRVEKRK